MAATVRTRSSRSTSPTSCAAIITLRTNGERGDQCSFIMTSRAVTRHQYYDFRAANATLVPFRLNARKHRWQWAETSIQACIQTAAWIAALVTVGTLPVCAETYPSGPITLVNPYAAGGPADVLARTMITPMSDVLGQPIVVLNKPGGATAVAAAFVAASAPDGQTAADVERVIPHRHAGTHARSAMTACATSPSFA